MPADLKATKKKKVRFKKLTFKVTEKQKKLIDLVSKKQRTTPNKLIKKALKEYLFRYADMIANEEIISKNQLKLFDDDFDDDDILSEVAEDTDSEVT
jgi:hypothetical protein